MTNKFTRGIPVIFASLMVTSGLYADSCEVKPNGCKGVSLCHTHPNIDCNGFQFDIGLILEEMRITGTDFAYAGALGVVNTTFAVASPTWNLDWGVSVGLGYRLPHDEWQSSLTFDWLRGVGTANTGGGGTIDVWLNAILPGPVNLGVTNSTNTRFTTNYLSLNAELGRGAFLSCCFSVEPHMGLKFDWIGFNQRTTINAAAGTATDTRNSNFFGVGPAVGMDSAYHLINNVSLFFDWNSALLVSQSAMRTTTVSGARFANATGNLRTISPAADMTIGLMYDNDVMCDCQHVRFRLGWDTTVVWNTWNHLAWQAQNGAANNGPYTADNNMFSKTGLIADFGWAF